MPFLIRLVAQRVIVGVVATMTFFGIAPEATIPDKTQIVAQVEERQQIIADTITNNNRPEKIDQEIKTAPKDPVNLPAQKPIQTQTLITPPKIAIENKIPITIPVQTPIDTSIREITDTIKNEIERKISEVIPEVIPEKTAPIIPEKTTSISNLANVLVNIICTHTEGAATTASTGSGVIVSPNGVVLTNAHVAQYFLLKNYSRPNFENCALYQENIPNYGFKADILYIQSEWVNKHYDVITSKNPRGTGEDDYAFLLVTGNTNPTLPLPSKFNYANISIDESNYEVGQKIQVGGFPGAPASILALSQAGNLQIDTTKINDVFTLGKNTLDVISTGETPVAQRGASGGGVFANGDLIGITVTTSGSGQNAKINALTTDYINRDLKSDTGMSLPIFIFGNVRAQLADFLKNDAPKMAELLGGQL